MVIMMAIISTTSLSFGARPQVTARTDSTSLVMGSMGNLQLQVVLDKGQQLKFPMMSQATQDGLIPLVGDTIELRQTFMADTVALGGSRIQVNCHFPLQAFVPGQYMIPAISIVADNDTAHTAPIALRVTGPEVTANDTISPDAGPLAPYDNGAKLMTKVTDSIPDIIYYWWWLGLIIIAVIGLLVWYLLKRSNKKMPWIKKKPEPTPYELAMSRLRNLRDRNLCEQGNEKEYYSILTDILREYLWGRFDINAQEMTTQQIRKAIRNAPGARKVRKYIEDVLGMADFVKFAKFKPLPDDNASAFENVAKFVQETKPADPVSEDQQQEPLDKTEVQSVDDDVKPEKATKS